MRKEKLRVVWSYTATRKIETQTHERGRLTLYPYTDPQLFMKYNIQVGKLIFYQNLKHVGKELMFKKFQRTPKAIDGPWIFLETLFIYVFIYLFV